MDRERGRRVHTKRKGRERIVGVASRDAKRFSLCLRSGRTIGLAGHKSETIRRESFIVLVKIGTLKQTTSHIP